MKSLSRVQLFVTPIDCSLPNSSFHGIFQAIVLEWIAISFSRVSSLPRDWTRVSRIVDRCFTVRATREVWERKWKWKSLSRVWLFAPPWNCSPPGSTVYGILQARVLEWIAISFSRVSSWPKDHPWVSCIAGRFFIFWATREACKGYWVIPKRLAFSLKFSILL